MPGAPLKADGVEVTNTRHKALAGQRGVGRTGGWAGSLPMGRSEAGGRLGLAQAPRGCPTMGVAQKEN